MTNRETAKKCLQDIESIRMHHPDIVCHALTFIIIIIIKNFESFESVLMAYRRGVKDLI